MSIVTTILATLVAAEFFFILYLETIATTSDRTAKVFGMTTAELNRPSVRTSSRTRTCTTASSPCWCSSRSLASASKPAVVALMLYVVAVAAYGSVTSNPKIILTQGGLAILALLSCLL